MSMTSLRMPDELAVKLDKLASKLKRKKGWIMNEAIRDYVEREEKKEQMLRGTLEGIESLEQDNPVDGDEVLQWLDSWGTEDELSPPGQD